MAKGEIIVEGAKCFCSNSADNNSKAKAVPLMVKSQTKKLGKNKYFAQEKPIATNLDDTSESFGGGNGFGMCNTPDNKKLPCKAKCNIKYSDYYKNVDFHKSMKVLLDISTGVCEGYGQKGTIEFATTGQKKAVNTIDVKEADAFTVENTSAQWETSDPTKEDSVSEITIVAPFAEKPTGKYYFIERVLNIFNFAISIPIVEKKLQLKAIYKGDPTKITWALYKGDGVNDKVKTFVGIGANIVFTLSKLFKDQEEGLYRIEAYPNKAGSDKCFILIEYIKDHVEGISAPGKRLIKNTPIPLTLKFKASSLVEKQKILNPSSLDPVYETSPIASWRVTCKDTVIFNSQISSQSNLLKVEVKTGTLGVFTFRNPEVYQIEAYTSANDSNPIKTTLTVLESLGINTVKGTCKQLLRYNESLKVEVSKYNVDFLPTNTDKMQWHLQKDGVRLIAFENAPISKEKSINKPINQILYYDAKGGNNYFGKYVIEGYAKPGNNPLFNGADTFSFEVIRNTIDKVILPKSIPSGAKVKLETTTRIMPLVGDEKIILELPNNVVDNNDGTLTFNSEGEFEIATYLTGDQTLNTKVKTKIKVANPELKRAFWAYGTGYKRTETGYKEETHAFVEITGLENQTITIKVWVRGASESFYLEPATYMLEEKKITLNDKGKGSFKIITDDKYKDKIKKALPGTREIPSPNKSLTFTVEMPTGSHGAVTLPNDMAIKNGKPVEGTKFIEVLNSNEELVITNDKKTGRIFFSTEDGKRVQQTLTHQNKTHKIWVHTVNMQEEIVRVDLMTFVHSDSMEEKEGIITALQSIQEYEEKVGDDGLLELSFTPKETHLTDAEVNPVRFCIQVSRKIIDPNDFRNNYYVFEADQLVTMPYPNASLVRSPDMKTIGIKATKDDETPFTKEEKIALRKKLICFNNTALIVAKGILTEEAIDNCTVPVVVDFEMAEVEKEEKNDCPRCGSLTADEITKIFSGASEADKGTLRNAFNTANIKFGLDTCQQKAHFFAQVMQEIGSNINVNDGENLNYKAEVLPTHFIKFSQTGSLNGPPNNLAFNYGRIEKIINGRKKITQNADKEMIANIAYANRNGNGNLQSGDGWKYRGRGIIQITGKDKYIKINSRINSDYPDFTTDIDANNINNIKEGTVASMAYWKEYKCLDVANKGYKREQLDNIVDIINRHTLTRNARWENLKKCIEIFKVKECEKNNSSEATEGEYEYYIYKSGKVKLKKGTQKKHAYYVEKSESEFKLLYVLEENEHGMVKIPDSGSGFNRYGSVDAGGISGGETVGQGDHYLLPKTAAPLFGIINEIDEKGWEIHLGDMSSKNGSDPWQPGSSHHAGHGHNGTRKGLDCDFRYLNTLGKSYQGLNTSFVFDAEKNTTIFTLAYKYGFRKNFCANPITVLGSTVLGVIHQVNHGDHGHIGLTDLDLEEV